MTSQETLVAPEEPSLCEECGAKAHAAHAEQFIYAIGQMDMRFPTVGIEREFQQRERLLQAKDALPVARGERLAHVLRDNPHLWPRVCFVFSVGNVPAYIVTPSSQHTLQSMLDAVAANGGEGTFCVLIGRRLATATPAMCGGLLAPVVTCDQLYASSANEWVSELGRRVEPALKARKTDGKQFATVAREIFGRIVQSTENIGALDSHRALNYVLVQHPGLAVSVAERPQSVLDRIETRPVQGADLRKIMAVVLTFVDRTTGVPERQFCRIDVTEEWPFLVDGVTAAAPALGLMPYVENAMLAPAW